MKFYDSIFDNFTIQRKNQVWPEGMDWDDAEDSGDIELFNFN